MRAVIGRLAVAGTLESTLQSLEEIPGVEAAMHYETDDDDAAF
jgi:hypothetical protein